MADLVLAFCTILGASVYLRAAAALPQLAVGDPVGPRLFPELVGIGLIAGGALLAFESWQKRGATAGVHSAAWPDTKWRSSAPLTLAGLVAWTLLYYAAFEPIGYIIATIIYASGALIFFHRTRWYWNVLTAVCFTLIAYAVFSVGLGVVLPSGLLGAGDGT